MRSFYPACSPVKKFTATKKTGKINVLFLVLMLAFSSGLYSQPGVAPVNPPATGFNIDGSVIRQGVPSDWTNGPGGPGIFSPASTAGNYGVFPGLVPLSFHLLDRYNDQTNDEIFDGGNKLNHNPNTWGWRSQKPPAKDDIHNAGLLISQNPSNGHIWAIVMGDRMSTNGTSYLDIEFYQAPITRTGGPIPGGTGGFTSAGPNNGRTVGDLDITLNYTGGGTVATISILQWAPTAEGGFDYIELTSIPSGTFFGAPNTGTIPVPYGAFGNTTYTTNAFVEAAINLTALIGGSGFPTECATLPFSSVFIKTKSSAAKTADLKDFISPLSIKVCFDNTPPVFTICPTGSDLGCNPSGLPAPGFATATDNCSIANMNNYLNPISSDGCNRTQTRIYVATDACGNTSTCAQTFTWKEDLTPPVFTGSYANVELGCNPTTGAIATALGSATATDACSTPTISQSDGSVISSGCLRTLTRTFTATDACGNTATISRSVTWTADLTPPVFTGSYASVELGCNPTSGAIATALGSATATDACSTPTISQSDGSVQSSGCLRTLTRTFTATDACGNTATISRSVTWTADLTPPVFTGSYASVELGCNPTSGAIATALGSATATDACSTPTISQSDGSVQSSGCLRTLTRTFTATDACGNTATISRSVTWTADLTPPVFTGSYASVELGCNPTSGAIATALGSATATDACSTPTISQSDGSVQSSGCLRTLTRTFTATDACGNTATISRSVTWTADLTPPVFTGSYASVELGCNPTSGAIATALGSATATDACSTPTISQSDGSVQSSGCLRTLTRTFTATDACGNTATISRSVTWTADLTPPVFTGSYASVELGCNPTSGAIATALGSATATDACSTPTISQSDGSVQSSGCLRTLTRTFTATDACGNTATISRSVTWTADLTPPVFTGSYASVELGCNPTSGAIATALGSATATDACSTPTISQSDGSVQSSGCLRTLTRTFTATDACGNTATISRSVTWTADLTPPVFTGSYASVELGCNPTSGAIATALGSATATDACSTPTISQSDGSVQSSGCLRTLTRTFTATDACGNTATISRSVTWTADLTPPVFTGSYASVELGCNPTSGAIATALGSATATDACSTPTISQSDGSVQSSGCLRTLTRTFTATDACGNTATISRSVTWTADLTPPVFTGSYASVELGCNPTSGAIATALGSATATDACSTPTISQSDGSVQSSGCLRTLTRTFTATDACGNTATISRSVTWTADLTPPVFTGSYASVELGCNPTSGAIATALGSATATDACSTPTISQSDGSVQSSGCLRTLTRTFTATDACGNTATISRSVTWTADLTPPVFTGSYASVELGCNPTSGAIATALGSATATDACSTPTISQSDGSVQSSGCLRTLTRTFTATDACGNTATISRSVTWTADLTPPVFTGSYASVELGCNPTSGAIATALGSATATDACSTPTISQSDGSVQSSGCLRTLTRTFTATDACGNTATISRSVTWTADLTPPVFTGSYASVELGCNPTSGAIATALGSATATDACSTPTISQSDGSVQSSGCLRTLTRTFTATDACGNTATISRSVTWTADLTPPVFTGSYASVELGCNPTSGAIATALGSATATDACSTPTISQSDGSVQSSGCLRTLTRTFTATDACGNTATISRSATWTVDTDAPVFVTTPASVDIACDAPIPDVVHPTASDACGGTPTVSGPVVTDDPASCETGFSRIITRTWTATDGCGNTATYTQTIRVECCDAICTYTQGFYGNAGGTACDGTYDTLTTAQLIANSLTNWGGTLTVGKPGKSVFVNNTAADINCVIAKLPGGGPAKELPAGNFNICSLPNSVAPGGGKIRNILLAQTLTLGLNLGINNPSPLASFVLQGGWLATQESVEGCGDNTPKERICVYNPDPPYNLVSVVNEYLYKYISPSVVNAITGPKTVANLFALANDALANTDGINGTENGVSIDSIAKVVGHINEAFDKCRIFIGWNVPPCPTTNPDPFTGGRTSTPSIFGKGLAVTAFPNPYEESFSLRINSPVSGNALVEFYTFDGRKITEAKKSVLANSDAIVQFNVPPSVYRSRIVYVVTIDKYTQRGIVLSPN